MIHDFKFSGNFSLDLLSTNSLQFFTPLVNIIELFFVNLYQILKYDHDLRVKFGKSLPFNMETKKLTKNFGELLKRMLRYFELSRTRLTSTDLITIWIN